MEHFEKTIAAIIDNTDCLKGIFDEYELDTIIKSVINTSCDGNKQTLKEIPLDWLSESIAFTFCEDYIDQETGWGTYYGPMMVFHDKDGHSKEYPSIQMVTSEMLTYWQERATKAKHPILKVRYADLVWDFSKKIAQKNPNFQLAHIVIDETIKIAKQHCHKSKTTVITKLKRALNLALLINDSQKVNNVKEAIISYENQLSKDKLPGLWGFSFDLLINNSKIKISDVTIEKIIQDLENHLDRVSDFTDKDNFDPWAAKDASDRLARYYKSLGQQENLTRVLIQYGFAFEKASEHALPLQASFWLQGVYSVFMEYGLRKEAEKIAIKIQELGPQINEGLHPISHEITVSKKEMEDYINSIIDDDLETTFMRIASNFVPRKDAMKRELYELAKKAPITYLAPRKILDHEGRPVASVGPLDDDLTGHIVFLSSQNMQISSIFLRCVLENTLSKFKLNPSTITEYLFQSPIFTEDKQSILIEGINHYIKNNHLVAIHLFIPQIESAIRKLVEYTGGAVFKPNRHGWINFKTLDELLRDEKIVTTFGEDLAFYFRILLTDPRGWNLRNDVCHGINPSGFFQINISDRLFHVLLCLALVRFVDNTLEKTSSE